MEKQLAMNLTDGSVDADSANELITYDQIHVSRSTFLNGLSNKVHRWFRLTPSFGAELVQEMVERLDVAKGDLILDPFAGAGTTLIEAKLEGHHALGFEINPLLHFVNESCLEWSVCPDALRSELPRLEKEVAGSIGVRFEDLEANGLEVPPIHNPTRWWRRDVLVQMLFLKRSILSTSDPLVRRLLLLALAGVLVPDLSNVTLGRLQLHFIDRDDDHFDVWGTYSRHALQIAEDLDALRDVEAHQHGQATCYHQNSLDLSGLKLDQKVSAVVTSPPYPNRYSYVWNTRPHLYMLDLMRTKSEAADLDKKTIGGTWGTATSELSKGVFEPINKAVGEVVRPVADQIRQQDNLMANYVVHYFNRLAAQILEMEKIVSRDARIAYVVGNSWIKGVYIETDVMLGEIIDRLGIGYKTFDIHRFRKRHSGVRLYESIVYAKK